MGLSLFPLRLTTTGVAGVQTDVTDVVLTQHPCAEALKAETIATVGAGTEFTLKRGKDMRINTPT